MYNDYKPLAILAKMFILNVWQGSKYVLNKKLIA